MQHEAQEAGFVPIGVEWPGMCLRRALRLPLFACVDDFKMAGPSRNMEQGWTLLKQRLDIGAVTGPGRYLGRDQSVLASKLPNGIDTRVTVCDMEAFLQSCVDEYLELVGRDAVLREAFAPFTGKDMHTSDARRPRCSQICSPSGRRRNAAHRKGERASSRRWACTVCCQNSYEVLVRCANGTFRRPSCSARLGTVSHKVDSEAGRRALPNQLLHQTTKMGKIMGWVGDDLHDIDIYLC